MPHVTGLFVYPVKSCRGHSLASAEVDAWGFVGDRRYMVVSPDGQFFTQRTLPRMALIDTELTANGLTLGSPNHGEVHIAASENYGTKQVTVWKNTVFAEECGDDAAEWLTRFLGTPARLVRMGPNFDRPVKPSKAKLGDIVTFADAFPFLILSEESLADLNDRIVASGGEPVPMDRFRPNLVIRAGAPFIEDTWSRFRIGDVVFRNGGPCARCIVTTTDQQTGERGKEPLKTLAMYRRDPAEPTDVNFGINLIHETKRGTIRVGDALMLES